MRKMLLTTVALLMMQPAVARAQDPYEILSQLFMYDATLPLNASVLQHLDSARFSREKFVFDGWRGTRVPGLIAVPRNGADRHPVVVLIDGIGGWKERWWQPTSWNRGRFLVDSLLANGYAVAMIDAWGSGERIAENQYSSVESFINKPAQLRDLIIQTTIEHRRLLDYLGTRADVDSARLGAVGLSMGGMMTFYLGATDGRFKAAVAGLVPVFRSPTVISPSAYAPHVTMPLLMLMGRNDAYYTKEKAETVLGLVASEEKDLLWYDVGHRLPEAYAGEAAAWFRRYLR